MKTDEQVLKEWALDRIEFQFDRRRYFTQQEFRILSRTLFFASTTVINLLKNQAKFLNAKGQKIYDLVLSNEEDDMLIAVRKKIKQPKFKHLQQMENLARFESMDELYEYVTGPKIGYEES